MQETRSATMQLLMRVKPEVHDRLSKRALNRSAELGRRVSMAFVLEELLNQADQIDHPDERRTDLFAAHD